MFVIKLDGSFYNGHAFVDGRVNAKTYHTRVEAIWALLKFDLDRPWRLVCADCGESPCVPLLGVSP